MVQFDVTILDKKYITQKYTYKKIIQTVKF